MVGAPSGVEGGEGEGEGGGAGVVAAAGRTFPFVLWGVLVGRGCRAQGFVCLPWLP